MATILFDRLRNIVPYAAAASLRTCINDGLTPYSLFGCDAISVWPALSFFNDNG